MDAISIHKQYGCALTPDVMRLTRRGARSSVSLAPRSRHARSVQAPAVGGPAVACSCTGARCPYSASSLSSKSCSLATSQATGALGKETSPVSSAPRHLGSLALHLAKSRPVSPLVSLDLLALARVGRRVGTRECNEIRELRVLPLREPQQPVLVEAGIGDARQLDPCFFFVS